MSTQELATQLCELKGTVEALFDIIANAPTEDNKREADSRQQEPDRQISKEMVQLVKRFDRLQQKVDNRQVENRSDVAIPGTRDPTKP
uniref:Uncharacterized protein n=1 Tax=Romanomermis culicivorax TaxID=13658 RepID=A0A915IRH6_ROMCU